jgi:hypothetical protein
MASHSAVNLLNTLEADNWRQLYECRWNKARRRKVVPILVRLLQLREEPVLQRTLSCVARIVCCDEIGALSAVVPNVARLATDGSDLTQRMAVGVLYGIGRDNPEAAVGSLKSASQRSNLLVPALQALIQIGPAARPAAGLFQKATKHQQSKVRCLGLRGLVAVYGNSPKTSAFLKKTITSDKSRAVRDMAEKLMRRLAATDRRRN